MDDIQTNVKTYILNEFLPDANPAELTPTTPLIAGGILDSLATVRLVTFLEQEYDIGVEAHEVNADNLDTLVKIAELVKRKRAGKAR